MDSKTKKLIASVGFTLAVILADKMFGVTNKVAAKLGHKVAA